MKVPRILVPGGSGCTQVNNASGLMDAQYALATGDLLLFSGVSQPERTVQRYVGSPWSQVALVLQLAPGGPLLVFESTQKTTCPDIDTGSILRGVQTVPLVDRVAGFAGVVAARRLRMASTERTAAVAGLLAFREEVRGRPYERSAVETWRAKYRRNRATDLAALFCSELVAEAYQWMGVVSRLPVGRASNNYTPADFGEATEDVAFAVGCGLGLERVLRGATAEVRADAAT